MTITLKKSNGRWWFEQDLPADYRVDVEHGIHVPDGCEFIDLFDAIRPSVKLHALNVPVPRPEHKCPACEQSLAELRHVAFNADWINELAEQGKWDGIRIFLTIV